jgi:hypothetical protein
LGNVELRLSNGARLKSDSTLPAETADLSRRIERFATDSVKLEGVRSPAPFGSTRSRRRRPLTPRSGGVFSLFGWPIR